MKPVPENPFYLTPWMPEEFFCDREGDIRGLMSNVRIGANTVLYAPPSAGKTALLYRFLRRPEIRNNYRTLYVALRGTKSQYDFFCALRDALRCKGVFSTYPSTYPDSVVRWAEAMDAGLFRTAAGGDREELRRAAEAAVEEMLFLLDKNGPGVVVFDDFHEIEHYDRSMAALLRTHIQFLFNTRFIYSSGDLPTLWKIFDNPEEPFYHSASTYAPKNIPVNEYLAFCQRCMALCEKTIGRDSVGLVCSLFRGNMKHMQEIMHCAYERPEKNVTPEIVDRVIEDILPGVEIRTGVFLAASKVITFETWSSCSGAKVKYAKKKWKIRRISMVSPMIPTSSSSGKSCRSGRCPSRCAATAPTAWPTACCASGYPDALAQPINFLRFASKRFIFA